MYIGVRLCDMCCKHLERLYQATLTTRETRNMKGWNEIKTVLTVMKFGTVSGAAKQLGVHRATVLRHVDTLESELKAKLFVRHANGYLPTDTGKELERIAKITEEQFDLFSKRIRYNNSELEGDFIITALDVLCPLLMPAICIFQEKHPKVMVNFQSSEDIFKLEYGQAHVAIRTGSKPTEDDYVCIPFVDISVGLYAHDSYVNKYGLPKDVDDFHNHYFVSNSGDSEKPPMYKWLREHVPSANIKFRCDARAGQAQAIKAGLGIGLMPQYEAEMDAQFTRVLPEQTWVINNWLITHGDLHRSEKIQAFLDVLKDRDYLRELAVVLRE